MSHHGVFISYSSADKPLADAACSQQFLYWLRYAGYGWLRPEGVRRELERLAAQWQGPPPMPCEENPYFSAA